ncbi:MAG: hypothetical protein QM640_07305 [Niabella sp.]
MLPNYRELYVNQQEDEVIFTENDRHIMIGFRQLLLTLTQNEFIALLQRFEYITTHPAVWKNGHVKSVMVEMTCPGLQMLFTRQQAERFYSVLLHAYVML